MHVNFRTDGTGCIYYLVQIFLGACIGGVGAEHNCNTAVTTIMPRAIKFQVFLQGFIRIGRNPRQTAAEAGTDARIFNGFGYVVHEKVHVRKTGCTAANHFGNTEYGLGVYDFFIQAGFRRPNFLFQPVHELHIVCIAAKSRHGNMIVCVNKSRQSQHIFAVYNRNVCRYVLDFFGKGRNTIVRNFNIAMFRYFVITI